MRLVGAAEAAHGFGLHDHVCWSFEDRDVFVSRAREFLAEGLRLGQQVWYVGSGAADALSWDVQDLASPGTQSWPDDAVRVVSLDAIYPAGTDLDPTAQVCHYADATEAAVEGGFTGLRVAADATALVRTPQQLDTFARYEHLIDTYMTEHPFAALCAYNHTELGQDTISQLACMHPVASTGTTPFRLHAAPDATASLAGELDLTTRQLFALALDRAALRPVSGELLIDASELSFMDHNSLLALADLARRQHTTVILRGGWPGTARLISVLGLDDIRAVPAG